MTRYRLCSMVSGDCTDSVVIEMEVCMDAGVVKDYTVTNGPSQKELAHACDDCQPVMLKAWRKEDGHDVPREFRLRLIKVDPNAKKQSRIYIVADDVPTNERVVVDYDVNSRTGQAQVRPGKRVSSDDDHGYNCV